jgi:hypothetical protein
MREYIRRREPDLQERVVDKKSFFRVLGSSEETFKHEVYEPCSTAVISRIKAVPVVRLGREYCEFLAEQNGCRLYHNSINLYGDRPEIRVGGLLSEAGPISIVERSMFFPLLNASLWEQGFSLIGAISADVVWEIVYNQNGSLGAVHENEGYKIGDGLKSMNKILDIYRQIDWKSVYTLEGHFHKVSLYIRSCSPLF